MSVRTMTTDALQKDLNSVMSMWGGGIPVEQADRVNALRGELKRRGVEARTQAAPLASQDHQPNGEPTQPLLSELNDQQLQAELDRLLTYVGKNPMDEAAQTRFADARYEVRSRSKKTNANGHVQEAAVQAVKVDHSERGVSDMQRMVEVKPQPLIVDQSFERNAAVMKEIEQIHIKLQQAQIAATVAARLLSDGAGGDIQYMDGDQIAAACDVGVAVASQVFSKLGLT